jgi:hypothetical protein
MSFIIILGVALWVFIALWPAILAKNKGYSFWLFLVLSWFVSFIITLIIATLLKDKNMTAADRKADKAAEAALDKEEGIA